MLSQKNPKNKSLELDFQLIPLQLLCLWPVGPLGDQDHGGTPLMALAVLPRVVAGSQLRGRGDFQAGPQEGTLGRFLLNYSEHVTCPRWFLAECGRAWPAVMFVPVLCLAELVSPSYLSRPSGCAMTLTINPEQRNKGAAMVQV